MKEKNQGGAETLIKHIREYARNLYQSRQMLCTEAVVTALNHGLNGGLTDVQAIAMAAPFCAALGESGCICGALSGAVLGSGLLLGKERAYRHRKEMRDCALQLHNAFKTANGSTCCRILSRKVQHDEKAHFQQCAHLTAQSAELAARLILKKRPALFPCSDDRRLAKRQSKISGILLRLVHFFSR